MKINSMGFNIKTPFINVNTKDKNALGISTNEIATKDNKKNDVKNKSNNKAVINAKNSEDTSKTKSNSTVNISTDTISKIDEAIENLKKQIQKYKLDDEMDDEIKKLLIKQLQDQIIELEKQKQQIKAEEQKKEIEEQKKLQEKANKSEEKLETNPEEAEKSELLSTTFDSLISADNSKVIIHGLKDIKGRENIERLYLEDSLKRNPDNKFTQKRLNQIAKSEVNISHELNNIARDMNKLSEEASEDLTNQIKENKIAEDYEKEKKEKEKNNISSDNPKFISTYLKNEEEKDHKTLFDYKA